MLRVSDDVPKGEPVFRFGLLGDIQYADADDAWDFDRTHLRHYRGALNSVRAAIKAWNASFHSSGARTHCPTAALRFPDHDFVVVVSGQMAPLLSRSPCKWEM